MKSTSRVCSELCALGLKKTKAAEATSCYNQPLAYLHHSYLFKNPICLTITRTGWACWAQRPGPGHDLRHLLSAMTFVETS